MGDSAFEKTGAHGSAGFVEHRYQRAADIIGLHRPKKLQIADCGGVEFCKLTRGTRGYDRDMPKIIFFLLFEIRQERAAGTDSAVVSL